MSKNNWKLIIGAVVALVCALLLWQLTYRFGFVILVFVAGLYVGYRWGKSSARDQPGNRS